MSEPADHNDRETPVLVLSCLPSTTAANALAAELVEKRLAAAVNVITAVRSFYRWQGRLCDAREQLLVVRSVQARYPDIEALIRKRHPYELPGIVCVPVSSAFSPYMSWIAACVSPT